MPEKFDVGVYEFIRNELSGMKSDFRNDLNSLETRIEKRFAEFEARTDKRFDKLEEEVRWPRRIAIGGVITTVIAVGLAIIGFKS
jgi:hypothetical protein